MEFANPNTEQQKRCWAITVPHLREPAKIIDYCKYNHGCSVLLKYEVQAYMSFI